MIIRRADCPSQPWKNGLGRTCQIAVQPSEADGEDFLWRVSVAEVDSAAPFSCFPGVDRHIVLLEGAGFTMTLDDGRRHALTTPYVPFAFPGEAKVEVALAGGATRDFNLMTRRSHARGGVQAWTGPSRRTPDSTTVLVFCARGEIDVVDGRLQAGDAWRLSQSAGKPPRVRDFSGLETRPATAARGSITPSITPGIDPREQALTLHQGAVALAVRVATYAG